MPSMPKETARGRPGKVPVPPEHPVMPKRSLVPNESQRLPGPPRGTQVADKKKPGQKFWTFRYEGDSGGESTYDEEGRLSNAVAFTPIELETPALVTLELFEDSSVAPPVIVLQDSDPPRPFIYDSPPRQPILTDGLFEVNDPDPAEWVGWVAPGLALGENDSLNPGEHKLTVNRVGLDYVYATFNEPEMILWVELEWDGGSTRKRYEVVSRSGGGGGPVGDHVNLYVNEIESEGAAPFPAVGDPITFRAARRNEEPAEGHLYIDSETGKMTLSVSDLDDTIFNYGWGPGGQLLLSWAGGSTLFTASNFQNHSAARSGGHSLWKTLDLVPVGFDPLLPDDGDAVTVQALEAPVNQYANARPRARIRYSAGTSDDIPILCDWRGKVQVMASRITIERLSARADLGNYVARRIQLSGIAMVGGSPSPYPPTLTEASATVASLSTRSIDVPPHAVRVSLLLRWGLDEDDPGDAPLGQVFVAFVSHSGQAIGFTDVMSSREALFGDGLPIPAGAVSVKLSNRVPGASVALGVVWHLGV